MYKKIIKKIVLNSYGEPRNGLRWVVRIYKLNYSKLYMIFRAKKNIIAAKENDNVLNRFAETNIPDWEALNKKVFDTLPINLPLVSVIVPCYNYGSLVQETIQSLIDQSYGNLEIIVIDDGSTDPETKETLERIKSEKIKVFHQINKGLANTRNRGIAESNGEFLFFIDNDDLIERHTISLLMLTLLEQTEYEYAYPDQWFFGDENLIWETQNYNFYDLLWANHPTVSSLVRKECLLKVGGYDEEMQYGWEDWKLWLSLGGAKYHGVRVPVPLFKHRRHGKTMTHTAKENAQKTLEYMFGVFRDLYMSSSIEKIKSIWRPAITVIIPYYNAGCYIDETVQSLLRQTINDFEIIIINDGTDEQESLVKLDKLHDNKKIKIITIEHRGAGAARNAGASIAKGEYVIFLDADDLLDSCALEKLLWFALLNINVGYFYPGVVHFGEIEGVCLDDFDAGRLLEENYLTSFALMKRDLYLAVGGQEESINDFHEDYDFWLKLLGLGITGKLFPEPLFCYRRHSAGRSARVNQKFSHEESMKMMRNKNSSAYAFKSADENSIKNHLRTFLLDYKLKSDGHIVSDFKNRYLLHTRKISRDNYQRLNIPNFFPLKFRNNEKINLLYFVPFMTIGGAEKVDLDILSGLSFERYHVTLIVELKNANEWENQFKKYVNEIFFLYSFTENKEQQFCFLNYIMISRNIDIVFNRNTISGYEIIKYWFEKTKEICFVDLLHLHNYGEDWIKASLPYHQYMTKRFVITEDLRNYIKDEYQLQINDFTVIHCGVDIQKWEPSSIPRNVLRKTINVSKKTQIVLFVGRLVEQKNLSMWLDIAKQVALKLANVHFVLIGDGPLREIIDKKIEVAGLVGKISLLGQRDDVKNLMIDADLLLVTSKYEGLPIVVFEAMSLGLPVVSSNVGGVSECITPNLGDVMGHTDSPTEYAKRVISVLSNENDSVNMKVERRNRIVKYFSTHKMQERYRNEFVEMTGFLDKGIRHRDFYFEIIEKPILQ